MKNRQHDISNTDKETSQDLNSVDKILPKYFDEI